MPDGDAMTIDERRKYLRIVQPRYKKADRQGRGVLLSEIHLVTGLPAGRQAWSARPSSG